MHDNVVSETVSVLNFRIESYSGLECFLAVEHVVRGVEGSVSLRKGADAPRLP